MLRIATWNVNSLRVRLETLGPWLAQDGPDVVCLQETKVTDDRFPIQALADLGYQAVFTGQKTYNGVALLSRLPITDDAPELFDFKPAKPLERVAGTGNGTARCVVIAILRDSHQLDDRIRPVIHA